MDLTNLSDHELHQLLNRLREELARRLNIQLTWRRQWSGCQSSGCRVVQVVFKFIPGMLEEVLEDLRVYGPTEKHKTVTDQETSTMTVYYSDPRDATDAVRGLADRYNIKVLESEVVETMKP